MDEEIYMEPFKCMDLPPAKPGGGKMVLKLKKAIYGTKQAGRAWRKLLESFLVEAGFKCLKSERCVFTKGTWKSKDWILIAVYVDDLLIFYDKERSSTAFSTSGQKYQKGSTLKISAKSKTMSG